MLQDSQNNNLANNGNSNLVANNNSVANTDSSMQQQNQPVQSTQSPKQETTTQVNPEELKIQQNVQKAYQGAVQEEERTRLGRVSEYIKNVEHKQVEETTGNDIMTEEDKEEKSKRLKAAIKNNLTGYHLEKEL